MLPYGGDRVRSAGGRVILHSAISKGWAARRDKTNVHAEFPGTAVLWDDEYFEVIRVELLPQGGVRYVLEPWRDEHVIRQFDRYDQESEARRLEDFRTAAAQRKKSTGARFAGVVLGHLPQHVQDHLQNELGVTPARMTMISCAPGLILFGICAWLAADARLQQTASPVPAGLWILAYALLVESGVRFMTAMLQNRGIGSMLGYLFYILLWFVAPNRKKWPSPFESGRGHKLFTLPPTDEIVLQDKITMRGAWMTLLTPAEQKQLAERYGFDYRKHAYGLTWIILVCSTFGVVSSLVKVADSGSVSALSSLIVAGALAVEQVLRLIALQRGPAGSFLGLFVRPFMRDLLERG